MALATNVLSVIDYSNERSVMKVHSADITAANIVAQQTAWANLIAAIAVLGVGQHASSHQLIRQILYSSTPPSNPQAQRERKWLIRSEDTVTHEIERNEYPCADATLLSSGSDFITDFTPSGLAAFKSAWESFVLSKSGNPVSLISLELVGKRL